MHGRGRPEAAGDDVHALLPTATDFALLVDASDPHTEPQSNDMRAAARVLGLNLHILPAASERDFAAVFESAAGCARRGSSSAQMH
jgi:hypothetical protein